MIVNQNITLEVLNKFKNETTLNEELKNDIYNSFNDSIEFQEFCKNKDNSISQLMLQEIEIDIYKDEYKCVYTNKADMISIYADNNKFEFYVWTNNGVVVNIDNTYNKNRKVPVFIRRIIDELLKFELIIKE